MTQQSKRVFSSHIDQIHYDPETQALKVEYQNGKVSVYTSVPSHVADNVFGAVSVGTALHATVKGKYPHSYMER